MDPTEEQVAIERDRRDLEDIVELKRSEPFKRYFLRRITQKKVEAEKTLKYENKLTHEQREISRVAFLLLEEIEKMLETDEGQIKATLARQKR